MSDLTMPSGDVQTIWARSCRVCGGYDSNHASQHNTSTHFLHDSVIRLCDAVEALSMLAMTNEEDQRRALRPVFEIRQALRDDFGPSDE